MNSLKHGEGHNTGSEAEDRGLDDVGSAGVLRRGSGGGGAVALELAVTLETLTIDRSRQNCDDAYGICWTGEPVGCWSSVVIVSNENGETWAKEGDERPSGTIVSKLITDAGYWSNSPAICWIGLLVGACTSVKC